MPVMMPFASVSGQIPWEYLGLCVQDAGKLVDPVGVAYEIGVINDGVWTLVGDRVVFPQPAPIGPQHPGVGRYNVAWPSGSPYGPTPYTDETATARLGAVRWYYCLHDSIDYAVDHGIPINVVTREFWLVKALDGDPRPLWLPMWPWDLIGSDQRRLVALFNTAIASLGTQGSLQSLVAVAGWCNEAVERVCRQQFHMTYESRRIEGAGRSMLFLPEPLLGVDLLGSQSGPYALGSVDVYGATGRDRYNPRIVRRQNEIDFFQGLEFRPDQPHLVRGVWGFVESDTQEAPRPVRHALARMLYLYMSGVQQAAGPKISETVDSHSVGWDPAPLAPTRQGLIGLLQDPAVRDVLRMYQAPMRMACVGTVD